VGTSSNSHGVQLQRLITGGSQLNLSDRDTILGWSFFLNWESQKNIDWWMAPNFWLCTIFGYIYIWIYDDMCGLISSYISYFDVIIRILAIACVTLGQWLQHVKLLPSPARWCELSGSPKLLMDCGDSTRSTSRNKNHQKPLFSKMKHMWMWTSIFQRRVPICTTFCSTAGTDDFWCRIAEASIEPATSRCLSWSNFPGVARLEKGAMPARSKSLVICYIAMV
jgi:hypothetical protein